jgi:hypothetical protein
MCCDEEADGEDEIHKLKIVGSQQQKLEKLLRSSSLSSADREELDNWKCEISHAVVSRSALEYLEQCSLKLDLPKTFLERVENELSPNDMVPCLSVATLAYGRDFPRVPPKSLSSPEAQPIEQNSTKSSASDAIVDALLSHCGSHSDKEEVRPLPIARCSSVEKARKLQSSSRKRDKSSGNNAGRPSTGDSSSSSTQQAAPVAKLTRSSKSRNRGARAQLKASRYA